MLVLCTMNYNNSLDLCQKKKKKNIQLVSGLYQVEHASPNMYILRMIDQPALHVLFA